MARALLLVGLTGAAASAVFSLFLYAPVAETLGNTLVTDRYDDLARGIIANGSLSYAPDQAPTVLRAPLYPLLLAASMALSPERWTAYALALQACLHGMTAMLACLMAFRLAGRRAALVSGLLCALHPVLLWYSGRLVIETLSTLLFTGAAAASVAHLQRPSLHRAGIAGGVIGLGLWCKAVFLPLLGVLPLLILLREKGRRKWLEAAVAVCAGLLVISPWLIRNHLLTGRWPVFQALVGYNLYVSDSFVDNAASSLFGYAELIARIDFAGMERAAPPRDAAETGAARELHTDNTLAAWSLARYRSEPLFLARKIFLNAVWFWSLGSRPLVSLFLGACQALLLAGVIAGILRLVRGPGWSSPALLPFWFALAYMAVHLPVFALGRFSVILIPSLIVLAASARVLVPVRP